MEVSHAPGFLKFNKKKVTGRPCLPCRTLGGTEQRAGRGSKTKTRGPFKNYIMHGGGRGVGECVEALRSPTGRVVASSAVT